MFLESDNLPIISLSKVWFLRDSNGLASHILNQENTAFYLNCFNIPVHTDIEQG